MPTYFISEHGRVLKSDLKRRKIFILTKNGNTIQWLPIAIDRKKETWNVSDAHLPIIDKNFPELQKVVLTCGDSQQNNYFVSKSNQKIALLSIDWLKKEVSDLDLPDDFENKAQLNGLLNNKNVLCKAAVQVLKNASTTHFHGKAWDHSEGQTPINHFFKTILKSDQPGLNTLKTALSQPKNEIRTVDELKLFAQKEIRRLNHWYIWNGRFKAGAIRTALQNLEQEWTKDSNMQRSPILAACESGLVNALAIHRHSFFAHTNRAKSHELLLEYCPDIKIGV